MGTPKHAPVTEGNFALEYLEATGSCPRCSGLTTLVVRTSTGVVGHVVAEWPWNVDIPEDPALHPKAPHYVVEWFGQDASRKDVPGLDDSDPYFIARALYDLHAADRAAA